MAFVKMARSNPEKVVRDFDCPSARETCLYGKTNRRHVGRHGRPLNLSIFLPTTIPVLFFLALRLLQPGETLDLLVGRRSKQSPCARVRPQIRGVRSSWYVTRACHSSSGLKFGVRGKVSNRADDGAQWCCSWAKEGEGACLRPKEQLPSAKLVVLALYLDI